MCLMSGKVPMEPSIFDAVNEEKKRVLSNFATTPRAIVENDGERPAPVHTYAIAACARWETPYIVEWVNYHRSIGFDHIYIYSNDDDPTEIYEALLPFLKEKEPYVTFVHYGFIGLQYQMYFHFLWRYSTETEYVMFLDVDEFLCLKGVDHIGRFMRDFRAWDAVYFNWCCFGNNGHRTRPGGSVLRNYTRREIGASPLTKVLVKTEKIGYADFYVRNDIPINHDPFSLNKSIKACNVIYDDMTDYYTNFAESAWALLNTDDRRTRLADKAFIAHYNIKSEEDFDLRVKRSLSGCFASQSIWGDLSSDERQNFIRLTNEVEDTYLADYWSRILAQGWRAALFPPSRWSNLCRIALRVTQSSTIHDRTTDEDARALINGAICGKAQNHTALEDNPWWMIDFGQTCFVHEMRLFNRLDDALDRMANFRLEASPDGEKWFAIMIKNDSLVFGGADGSPYVWLNVTGIRARCVRLTIPGRSCLHFDQIEFYGRIASDA